MSANISISIKSTAGWLAGLMIASTANAGSAYLPATGPTPLRFEIAMIRPVTFLPVSTASVDPKKEEAPITPAETATNLPETIADIVSQAAATPAPLADDSSANSLSAHSVAENMLIITPQMLSEYFKPFGNGTNLAGVSVLLPMPVGFTPPMEKDRATSRATYKKVQ